MRPARILGSHATAVRLTIAVLALATLVGATVGCGGDTTTTSAAPTTTQTPGTTATSEVAPTTTPTTSTPDTSTPTTAGPTTTTASGPTTTEQLSSAETRQPDGTIKGMGFIDRVWVKDGVRYLSIDYAEMLSGDAALKAAIDDGFIKPGETLVNDYYIRNQNTKKREFKVATDVAITTQTRGGGFDQPATWDEFLSFWGPTPPEDAAHPEKVPWWIVRDGTEVISISEQYLP